eukprot:376307-Hanusia_phi.AAC.3
MVKKCFARGWGEIWSDCRFKAKGVRIAMKTLREIKKFTRQGVISSRYQSETARITRGGYRTFENTMAEGVG